MQNRTVPILCCRLPLLFITIYRTRKPSIFGSGAFLYVTTYEMKEGFLLIEVFSNLFNTQIYGHQDLCLGDLFIEMQG